MLNHTRQATSPIDPRLGSSCSYSALNSSGIVNNSDTSCQYLNVSHSHSFHMNGDSSPAYSSLDGFKPADNTTPQISVQASTSTSNLDGYCQPYLNISHSNGVSNDLLNRVVDSQYLSKSTENLVESGISSANYAPPNYIGYYKETVEDLGPEEFRWFYKAENDKKWIPFIGYDSLRIEWKYRDLLLNGIGTCVSDTLEDKPNVVDSEEKPFELGEEGTVMVRGGNVRDRCKTTERTEYLLERRDFSGVPWSLVL